MLNYRHFVKVWLLKIRFVGLVGFNGISTFVGYLMPEPFYTYIYDL